MKAYNRQMLGAGRLATLAKRFLSDKRGVAAMEFAFIAPILIALYLGSIEATSGLDVNKKLGRSTNMVADLVTQQQTINTDRLRDIMEIGTALLLPYRSDTPQITITAINIPAAGSPTVAWSRRVVNNVFSRPYAPGLQCGPRSQSGYSRNDGDPRGNQNRVRSIDGIQLQRFGRHSRWWFEARNTHGKDCFWSRASRHSRRLLQLLTSILRDQQSLAPLICHDALFDLSVMSGLTE